MKRQRQKLCELLPGFTGAIVFGNVLFLREVGELEIALVLNLHGPHYYLPPGEELIAYLTFQGQPHKRLLVLDEQLYLLFIIDMLADHWLTLLRVRDRARFQSRSGLHFPITIVDIPVKTAS